MFSNALEIIEKTIGTEGETNGEQLSIIARLLFGDKFIGVFPINSPADTPELEEGQIAILNTDNHWYGAYRKNGKLYETDSYGDDRLGKKYKNQPVPVAEQQKLLEANCGQRLLLNIMLR